MRHKRFTSVIAILLLGVFLGIKALDYHPLTHSQDEPVKCELCTLSLLHESTSFDRVVSVTYTPVFWDKRMESMGPVAIILFEDDPVFPSLFGRPPPFLG
ncbi:hypothetical protein SAMN06265375_1011176 [Muriicola jejuensis]|uniref:Uncharacterized protein n=1 Tax=Muriicola jejuensis TaxID=504488 RepID=A0A6P0UCH0_9FLAO|nr:hypothetical protein [Muriicola jejuensis]NER09328.1 hypothetical protein [Muriicola jejuensis]SMP09312.1 hypothetical protein SAMN06265375_1011176 [Muriicola jejuensis]